MKNRNFFLTLATAALLTCGCNGGGEKTPTVESGCKNPVMWTDIPDLSMVRVNNNYYLTSTTMHLNPGVPVMKSTDLSNWEIVSYCYDTLGVMDETTEKTPTDVARGQVAFVM